MKTILHLQTNLNIACGVSKIIYLIIKHSSSDYRNEVIALGGDGIERFKSSRISPKIINYNRNSVYGTLRIFFFILNFCKNNNIDLIHSHHRYFDLLSWIISKIVNVKTITTVHSITKGKKFISYKSDFLTCCSNSVKIHLIKHFRLNENKIKLIPNFIDPEEVKITNSPEKMKAQLGISNQKIIGYIGRIDFEEKGVDILLAAYNELRIVRNDTYLLLIGDGNSTELVKNFIGKEKINVILIGPQLHILDYYNIMDIVVLPSRTESFGLVILEAGLMKKTFVGSRIGGIEEVIKNNYNGVLFSSGNIHALSKTILQLLNNDNYSNALADNLNRTVIDNYSAEKIAPLYDTVYEKIINETE